MEYLLLKRGSKGNEINYSCIKMAEYLLPNDEGLSISDQRYIFSIRNSLVPTFQILKLKISVHADKLEARGIMTYAQI